MKANPHLFCILFLTTVSPSHAETWGGFALTSDYVAGGYTQTQGKPALQGYVDHTFTSGFYFGAWASTVDLGTPDRIELDLYGGFRGAAGKLSYDLGYYRYVYDKTGDCCGDLVAKLNWSVNDTLTLGVQVKSDLSDTLFVMPSIMLTLPQNFDIKAEWEDDQNSPERYWGVTARKHFDGGVAAGLSYYDRTDIEPTVVLSVSLDTQLFK